MSEVVKLDREKLIQEIAVALSILEKCNADEIKKVKKFLRWMSDDALQDMRNKHMQALEKMTAGKTSNAK